MSKLAAIEGQLVDAKNIAVHKTLRLSIDVPVERAQDVLAAFGWPTMASPVPVALARILPESERKKEPQPDKPKRNWNELSRAQQAGIACNEKGFWTFLGERHATYVNGADDAADIVRKLCDVGSRSQIDGNEKAVARWDRLHSEYHLWLRAPEVVG